MIFRSTLSAILFAVSFHAAADFKLADSYYEQGKFQDAYSEYYLLATNGDHDAQFNLGAMNLHGQSIAADAVAAYAWVALAAQDGNEKRVSAKNAILELVPVEQKKLATDKEAELFSLYGDKALEQKMTPNFSSAEYHGPKPLKKIIPDYPMDLRMNSSGGVAELSFTIDKSGIPHDFGIITSPGKSALNAAVRALRQWRYEPAQVDGKAVETYNVLMRFSFTINGQETEAATSYERIITRLKEKAESGQPKDIFNFALASDILISNKLIKIDPKSINENYFSAATKGFSPAQFQLGHRMLVGNACTADAAAGKLWLMRAALAGSPDAQYLLASEMLSGGQLAKDEAAAMLWLERAAETDYPLAKIKLAWILATNPDAAKRNGQRAEYYLKRVPEDYLDRARYYETYAAVYAETNDFERAVEWQNKAIKDAKEFGLPLAPVQAKLDAYTNSKTWTEAHLNNANNVKQHNPPN